MYSAVVVQKESLEDEECSGQPSEVDSDQLRASSKPILLKPHKKLPKNSLSTILQSFGIWGKLERWKRSVSGCLMSWPKIKKKNLFWSVIFSYSMQQQAFSRLDRDVWWKLDFTQRQLVMTSSVVGHYRNKRFSLAKMCDCNGSYFD